MPPEPEKSNVARTKRIRKVFGNIKKVFPLNFGLGGSSLGNLDELVEGTMTVEVVLQVAFGVFLGPLNS